MTIQRMNPETLSLKLMQTMVTIKNDGSLRVGDRWLEGPGEYDIDGVAIHTFASYALVYGEGLHCGIVWSNEPKVTLEEESGIDVAILLLGDAEAATAIIKAQEPRVVVITSSELSQKLHQQDGVTITEESSYKVTAQSLPAEEQIFVLIA